MIADEMFEKLGYKKTLDEDYMIYYEKGSNVDEETGTWYGTLNRIYIDKEHKLVGKEEDYGNDNTENDIFTFEEIQAINKKFQELEWSYE